MEGSQTVIIGGSKYKGYVYVDEDCVTAKKDFDWWAHLSLTYNDIAKLSKPK